MLLPSRPSRRRLLPVAAAVAAWLLLTGVVLAAGQTQAGSDPKANLPYLLGVYTVTWLAFFAYAFYITRRQRELHREIQELRQALEDRRG